MEKKKSYLLLTVGAIILIASLIYTVIQHNTTYAESLKASDEITALDEKIKAEESKIREALAQELDEGAELTDEQKKSSEIWVNLNAQKAEQKEIKAEKEKGYSFGLAVVFLAVLLTVKGIYNALIGKKRNDKYTIQYLTMTGLMAGLCFIGFFWLKIDIVIPFSTEKSAFHLGNVFCVLGALLLGGYWGGMAGAIGMTIGDFLAGYVTSAPKTFFLKLMIGLIVGFVAHKLLKISKESDNKKLIAKTVLACVAGLGFNVIAEPVVGYFYKTYLLGVPQDLAKTLAKLNVLTTSVNAVVAVIIATVLYRALKPAMKKAGLAQIED